MEVGSHVTSNFGDFDGTECGRAVRNLVPYIWVVLGSPGTFPLKLWRSFEYCRSNFVVDVRCRICCYVVVLMYAVIGVAASRFAVQLSIV